MIGGFADAGCAPSTDDLGAMAEQGPQQELPRQVPVADEQR
jgi:hypothetical protein